jgi:hypothetical protein
VIHTVSTFGAAKTHPLSIAANWSHLMHEPDHVGVVIIIALVACVLYLVTSIRKTFSGR